MCTLIQLRGAPHLLEFQALVLRTPMKKSVYLTNKVKFAVVCELSFQGEKTPNLRMAAQAPHQGPA